MKSLENGIVELWSGRLARRNKQAGSLHYATRRNAAATTR